MKDRKFEEEVVEETTVTEEVTESAPDSHETFVNLLVDMGLSAEQAEAVHQMAMELIDAGEAEVTEEVKEEVKVEASRDDRRSRRGRGKRRGFTAEQRTARKLARLRRQNIELRKQLREFGQTPATKPLRNAPSADTKSNVNLSMGKATSKAFNMINTKIEK